MFQHALCVALEKAEKAPGIKGTLKEGVTNALDMVFAVLPVVMAVGTFALIIAEYTPIFQYLGTPFVPYLELLQVPEAAQAAQTIVVGFADMFIPSILAASSIDEYFEAVIDFVNWLYVDCGNSTTGQGSPDRRIRA